MTRAIPPAHRLALALACVAAVPAAARTAAAPTALAGSAADRAAIDRLLATYTRAVSTHDQALFETILLDRDIPFAYVGDSMPAGTSAQSTHAYEPFRKGVFEGPPVRQSFDHVRVEQDGALAQVSVIFRNRGDRGLSWGFKTLQLLKVGDRWKIASEFFTVHDGVGPKQLAGAKRGS